MYLLFSVCSSIIQEGNFDFCVMVLELMKCLHVAKKMNVLPLFNTFLEIHVVVPLHSDGWGVVHGILVALLAEGKVCTSDIGGMVKVTLEV